MFFNLLLKKYLFVLILLCHSTGTWAQLNGYKTFQPVDKIDFSFVDEKGISHKISDYKGKIVVLNFWATWCPPCVAEMPSLNNLAGTFPSQELVVLTLCKEKKLQEDAKKLFINKNLKNLTLYFDDEGAGAKAMIIKGLPTTFVLDRSGYLIGKLQGATEWEFVLAFLSINVGRIGASNENSAVVYGLCL